MKKHLILTTALCAAACIPAYSQTNLKKVTKEIDMDGSYFMANDVENDLSKLARLGNDLLANARANGKTKIPENLDINKVLRILGADQLVAYGRSAKHNNDHWSNKMYLQTGGTNKGLFSFMGEKAQPFGVTSFAPEGTDLAVDFQLDYSHATALTKELSKEVKCEKMQRMSRWADRPINQDTTWGDLASQLQLQVSLAVKLDDKERKTCPHNKELTFPVIHSCARVKGFNPLWKQFKPMSGFMFKIETLDDGTYLLTPLRMAKRMEGCKPVIHIDEKNDLLWVASSKEFLQTCQAKGKKLGQEVAYNTISAGNGKVGNAMAYLSRQACLELRKVAEAKRATRDKQYLSDDYFKFMLDHMTESKNGYFASMAKTDQGIKFLLQSPCPIKEIVCGKKKGCRSNKGCKGKKGCGCKGSCKGKCKKASAPKGCPMH